MVKGKSFNTLFVSSWKYDGACANPKGTFRYSYFPTGDVKALLVIESAIRCMRWYPVQILSIEKNLALFSFEKMSSTHDMGHMNFCCTLFKALLLITSHFHYLP